MVSWGMLFPATSSTPFSLLLILYSQFLASEGSASKIGVIIKLIMFGNP